MRITTTIATALALVLCSSVHLSRATSSEGILRIPLSKSEGSVRASTPGLWAYSLRKFGLMKRKVDLMSTAFQTLVPLVDVGFDKEYYGIVKIGTPPQSFKMQFDTGSSRFVLSTEGCDQCSGDSRFDRPASSTFKVGAEDQWEISYGDGSYATGVISQDYVTLGNITVHDQNLNLALDESAGFDDTVDGVIGLSFGKLSNSTTIFENMVAQGRVPKGIFSFYLGKRSLSGGGEVVFGGLDMDHIMPGHNITYTPVIQALYWKVVFRNIIINGEAFSDAPRGISMPVVIDTGSTLLIVPQRISDWIHQHIPGARSFSKTWTVPCDIQTKGPLEFDIEGKRFGVPAADLVRERTRIHGLCYSAIQSSSGNYTIIGDIFLKNNYVVFDQENRRVGFAPVKL